MSIVEDIYKKDINTTDLELTEEILKYSELSILDLWLLPEYPFNQWRKKYDYPRLIKNIQKNQSDFVLWMNEQNLTEDDLLGGYLTDFFENKPLSEDKRKYLVRVSYKGETSLQAWHRYDGITQSEEVKYEFLKEFISYYDWKLKKGEKFSFLDTFERYYPNTPNEEVFLNHNIKLLKMGGIAPPTNPFSVLLRGKKLDFINASGLDLKGTIHSGDMGNLSFDHCAVDNMKCSELDMPSLKFQYCSIKNLQIRNSNVQQWLFVSCNTTGNIIDTKLSSIRIFGGQFNPTFTNSEIEDIEVHHKGVPYDNNFEKTYRALAKSAKEAGNIKLSQNLKIAEFDFVKDKTKGIRKYLMSLDRFYWGYGQKPKRLIYFALITILGLGVFYSFFPNSFNNTLTYKCYFQTLYNSLYFSVVTFTTLGFGDISPTGFLKILSGIEALFGVLTFGFLIAGLTKNE
jgi:hypothetical protein